MEEAKAIQDRLDDLQQEMHAKVEACDLKHNQEKNAVFAARRQAIAELTAKGELPANFWAQAFVRLLRLKDRESTTMPHFLGPYDEALLNDYLEDLQVLYTDNGHKITLKFKSNPFFEETEVWAEAVDSVDAAEDEEDDDAPPMEESWAFSGVTWKDGHGPLPPDEESEEDEETEERPGTKRAHADAGSSSGPANSMHGPSVLEVFTEMPPHPEDDEEMDEEDDDAVADAIEEWEAEMDDRKMLLRLTELFVHHNPVAALTEGAAEAAADSTEPAAKEAKTE